jgi:RHS repeat-associated protein
MVTCLPKASDYSASQTITAEAYGSAYKYDQLNRLASSRVFTNINTTTNEWQSGGGTNPAAYATDYTYDAMGNILTQKRNGGGASPVALDELTYNYHTTTDGLVSNRLYHVDDAVTSTNYTDDIDDQGTFNNTHTTIETANNYGYDELGNLVRDVQEDIAAIEWTVYGKIKKVTRTGSSTKADLEFGYDAGGNRLWKKVTPKGAGAVVKTFYYLRDAQGNEMCRYVKYINTASQTMYVSEEHSIYGSSRVGVDNRKDTLYMGTTYTPTWGGMGTNTRELGEKSFELSNHLGNVLVTVSDKLVYKTSSGTIYFEAEITSITDYYPFGSCISIRSFSSTAYRYGFNGKEKDNESNCYDYGFRIYYPALCKFLSVDPLFVSFAWYTPYQFAGNMPTSAIDLDGLEEMIVNQYMKFGVPYAYTVTYIQVSQRVIKNDANGKAAVFVREKRSRADNKNYQVSASSKLHPIDEAPSDIKDAVNRVHEQSREPKTNGADDLGNIHSEFRLMNYNSTVKFETNETSTVIPDDATKNLQTYAVTLLMNPELGMKIEGYADAQGVKGATEEDAKKGREKNEKLSLERAELLKNYIGTFLTDKGASKTEVDDVLARIKTIGKGTVESEDDGKKGENPKNRKAEISLTNADGTEHGQEDTNKLAENYGIE